MHTLLQRLRLAAPDGRAAPARGTTVVREDPGSGAGAVLFQPYRIAEFVPEADGPVPLDGDGRRAEPAPPEAPAPEPAPHKHVPNSVAEDWRRTSPEVFRTVARRFCARAPQLADELRAWCLAGERKKLAHLAQTLKPTLSLFDVAAAEAAGRLHAAAETESPGGAAYEVLALEHEIWRVVANWQATDGADARPATEDPS